MDAGQEAWLMLRSFTALVVVLALAWLSLRFGLPWLMRRKSAGRVQRVRVEEFHLLDRNHRLYLVSWDDAQFLLATSPERVQLLHARASAQEGEDFKAALDRATGGSLPKEEKL